MYIVLDVILLAVLVFFVWRGAKRGFVLSLCGLVAVIVALLGSAFLANLLAPRVGAALEPQFTQIIQEQLEESLKTTAYVGTNGGAASGADEVAIPGVLDMLRELGFYEDLIDSVEEAVNEGLSDVAATAAAAVAAAIAQSVAYAVIFFVSFILILVAWTLLSHALDLVARLPGLNSLNKLGGGAMGLLKGMIILFVAAWLLRFFGDRLIPQETVEQTYLLKFFLNNNPVIRLTGL